MRRALTFVLGVLVGQWLVFGSGLSPAELHVRATRAYERHDFAQALRLWSHAVALQPAEARLHYLRGRALAGLGLRVSAADAFQVSLALEPSPELARDARQGLASLSPVSAAPDDMVVSLESGLGVWIVAAEINGTRPARLLLDTGSSVVVIAPALADALGIAPPASAHAVELQTIGGRTRAPAITLASLRLGTAEVRDLPVVVHDPGPGVDGILGNTFLTHFRLTLDADARQLVLRRSGT